MQFVSGNHHRAGQSCIPWATWPHGSRRRHPDPSGSLCCRRRRPRTLVWAVDSAGSIPFKYKSGTDRGWGVAEAEQGVTDNTSIGPVVVVNIGVAGGGRRKPSG